MGRLLFPDSGEAFGYKRIQGEAPQVQPVSGTAAYGPQQIGAAIGAVEKGFQLFEHVRDEYAKPFAMDAAQARAAAGAKLGIPVTDEFAAQQLAANKPLTPQQAAPGGYTGTADAPPMGPTLVRRPVIAGGQPVVRHGDVQDVPQPQPVAPDKVVPTGNASAGQAAFNKGANAELGNPTDPNAAQRARLEAIIAQVETQVKAGARLSPNAQAQLQQAKAQLAALNAPAAAAPAAGAAPSATPTAAPAAGAAPAASPYDFRRDPTGAMARGLANVQQVPRFTPAYQRPESPPKEQPDNDGQPAAEQPQQRMAVNVDPQRGHSIAELQALIGAAHRTGNPEDFAAVQQAIMAAPLADAKPESWFDIFSEIGGKSGSHRETTRRQLLAELSSGYKGNSEMDQMRMRNLESQMQARQVANAVREQDVERKQRENRYGDVVAEQKIDKTTADIQGKQTANEAARYAPAEKAAKASTAVQTAEGFQKDRAEKHRFQRVIAGASALRARAGAAHEDLPGYANPGGDRHVAPDRTDLSIGTDKRRDIENLRNRIRDALKGFEDNAKQAMRYVSKDPLKDAVKRKDVNFPKQNSKTAEEVEKATLAARKYRQDAQDILDEMKRSAERLGMDAAEIQGYEDALSKKK